jgi:hypothetical protein
MFYIIIDAETKDACLIVDDDGVPESFLSEDTAVKKAKEYCGNTLVVRAVGRLTEKTTYKYTKTK